MRRGRSGGLPARYQGGGHLRVRHPQAGPPPPPYCCPYPCPYCTLTPSLPVVAPTRVPTVHSLSPSLLLPLPVSLLYTHSLPLEQGVEPSKQVAQELKNKVRQDIGAFAAPDQIHFASGLPKTRSGKIMRRILRKIAAGSKDSADMGDISTLADPSGPPFPVVREASPMLDVVQSLGRRLSRSIRLST